MVWTQHYDPCGSVFASAAVASIPIVLLLGLLASGRVSAPRAALAGLVSAYLVALFVFTPPEAFLPGGPGLLAWAGTLLSAAGYGAAFGLMPIGWIVLSALFLYNLTVETGRFELVKRSVVELSDDRRLQALLIAFCFGAFIEGAAGFGTPVAISAALLTGAGFRPLHAAGLSLLANTAPVAFGGLGAPIIMLAKVTGLSEASLSTMAGRQLPFFSLIIPVWLVWMMSGWRGVRGVWPALLVCGGSFSVAQFAVSNYHGPWLVDVIGGVVALVSLAVLLRFWRPKNSWRFPHEAESVSETKPKEPPMTRAAIASAWVPWVLLSAFVFCWGLPAVKTSLAVPQLNWAVPGLDRKVTRTTPVVEKPKPEEAVYDGNIQAATGTGIFLAAVASAFWMGVTPVRFLRVFLLTCHRIVGSLLTIACMLALAYTTRYSGMDATLGLACVQTGSLYPLFAALLGWLGVALTGSDTSSNALFGSLQRITGESLARTGVLPLTAAQAGVLLAATNSTGGVMGKMIDAQSIVVSTAATQQPGQEGAILRYVFWHSLALALLMGLLVMFQAYVWTSVIP
jgi:lactate permease